MRWKFGIAAWLAIMGSVSVQAQDAAMPPADTPEEIAKDAARDLKGSRFYNKPGATRAQYDTDWQQCRLIARGSRTPTGTVPMYYNPAVVSPMAAAIGGGLGGLIGAAIAEGEQRRANRRACLLIRGWRLVEVPSDQAAGIAAMTDDARSAYFDGIVGAAEVKGEITERTSFTQVTDSALRLDAPMTGPGTLFMGKKVDPAAPLVLAPGEGAVVLAFRRPDAASAGRSGQIDFARYDMTQRDLFYRPRDWKKRGDTATYLESAMSRDRNAAYEVHVRRVTAGDYVLTGRSAGPIPVATSYCFGAPTFSVAPGQIVYLGDFIPFLNVKMSTGARATDLIHTRHIDDVRQVLADRQPDLAKRLEPALLRDRATYACAAINMDRWDIDGADDLAPLTPAPTAVDPVAGASQPAAG
ncbi:hypothetical protein ABC347_12925 [Sphingomonas sp. 1P06PA]|uniref:hypothetical protein n=1 Tax=Sphingomonas sp. 1P06PA TaxID=554121 RepID=UPI0039A5F9D4